MRHRWRSLLIVAPYLLVVAASFFGFRHIENVRNQDCLKARDGRTVLRQVVVEATKPGRAIDLTHVPGFDNLDPAMQTYLTNLSAGLNGPSETATTVPLRDRLLDLIPPINC